MIKGLKCSKETKIKISESNKRYYIKHPERGRKISEAKKGKSTKKYGYRNNTKEQVKDFIGGKNGNN